MNGDRKIRARTRILLAGATVLVLGFAAPAARAQNPPPPEPEPFKAMQTPTDPAQLTTPPAGSLLTPSLSTPATGPVNPPAGFTGGKMVMKQTVWQDYLRYLRDDVAIGYGLFLVTVDGSASFVNPCKDYACQISPVSQSNALSDCRSARNNRRCVVFAEGRDIKYAYQVVP